MSKQEKSLEMTILMTPDMANFSGNVHGGSILKLLDQVAYACAARYCKSYVVTLSLDQVTFKAPIKVGELVTFRAHVNYVGTSSLEVGVKVFAEDIHQKNVRHTNSCYFTMVSVDDEKKPMAAPKLELENDFEKKLFEAAKMRKELRNEIVKRNKDITSDIPDYNSDLMNNDES